MIVPDIRTNQNNKLAWTKANAEHFMLQAVRETALKRSCKTKGEMCTEVIIFLFNKIKLK